MRVLSHCCRLIAFSLTLFLPYSVMADQNEEGKALFATLCTECHGVNGDGHGPVAETMPLKPRDFALAAFKFDTDSDWQKGTDIDLANDIRQGPGAFGGSALMPPFAHLGEKEISSLVSFIRSRKP